MNRWRPQQFRNAAIHSGADPHVADNAVRTGAITIAHHPDRPPIFSLRHLSHLSGSPYGLLRSVVSRNGDDPYHLFRVRKHARPANSRYRTICVPQPFLMRTQSWIAQFVLQTASTHHASTGFSKGDDIVSAAQRHSNARWLVKLDVANFFESITEISVYRVFLSLGYQPLVAFELARLCTRVRTNTTINRNSARWRNRTLNHRIWTYNTYQLGYLPQGAPTSPMMSNLAVIDFDKEVDAISNRYELRYSRYADDICLSTTLSNFSRREAKEVVRAVCKTMIKHGLSPNHAKTDIRPPGSRKVVLGLLVDGEKPRLTREYKARLRMHLYFLNHPRIGPVKHANVRGFDSIVGLRAHVRGLIAHAQRVEPKYAAARLAEFSSIDW